MCECKEAFATLLDQLKEGEVLVQGLIEFIGFWLIAYTTVRVLLAVLWA
jgi:hypothetical protein